MEQSKPLHIKKPSWLKTEIPKGKVFFDIKKDLRSRKLFTVCEEAKCPNIGECWNTRTATFMILGDTCTRACRFCNVKTGNPQGWLDQNEPEQVAESCLKMGLKYVVITMVDRDDLGDGGAEHIAKVVDRIKILNAGIKVELLAGDFRGEPTHLAKILSSSNPDVFAHNLETVERLTPRVRDARAGYRQSLSVLKNIKKIKTKVFTKSALMLGLGETVAEVKTTLQDMRNHDVDFVTIGQYMRPTKRHLSIKKWVEPQVFEELDQYARSIGFMGVASSPLVRSSYKAREFFENAVLKS